MKQFPKDIELTYQLSLDHFLAEQQAFEFNSLDTYQTALNHLDEIKKVRSSKQKLQIAYAVIENCPNCVEAYLVLSIYAPSLEQRLHALQQASQLAMMKLGQDFFEKDTQDYFLNQETHLFFRSKTAYALALFDAGFLRKAKTHLEVIKRLNPSDAFHVNHYLLCIYLILEDKESGYAIIQNLAEHDAFTCFTKALYAYKDLEFEDTKRWLKRGKKLDESIYQVLCHKQLPQIEDGETTAEYFLMIYEKALRSWKEFAMFVKAI